jgi:hypothetical protein
MEMTTCDVLRCDQLGLKRFLIRNAAGENDEKIICEMHHNAMLQGARWVSHVENHEVLMGFDAPPVLTEVSVTHAGSSNLSSQPVFMNLYMRSSDGSERSIEIEVTNQLQVLRALLKG